MQCGSVECGGIGEVQVFEGAFDQDVPGSHVRIQVTSVQLQLAGVGEIQRLG